jgi:hypothetical protein
VTATSAVTFTASPTPVTDHPRFLITQANLPALRAKATSGNLSYQSMRNQAINYYSLLAASPYNWSFTCNSGTGQPAVPFNGGELVAYYFAYMALVDPSDPTYHWSCYGHDSWIYAANYYMTNGFPTANQWSDYSPQLALTTDWLLGAGALTSSGDLTTSRKFLAYLAKLTLTFEGLPNPTGTWNSSSNFDLASPWTLGAKRNWSGNNYSLSAMLITAAAGLTFNDTATDSPAMTSTCGATRYQVCADFSAGSLQAYWRYWDQSLLYNYWSHISDPNVTWQAYQAAYSNLPTQPMCESTDLARHPCFGEGRGGESSEGSWYQYSMYRARYALNMLHTAGMDDPILYGPQISAGTDSWWDLKYVSDLEFMTGPPSTSNANAAPAYNYLTTGDSNTYYRQVSDAWTEAAMLTFDSETGRTDRTNALKWIEFNWTEGGPLGTSWGCTTYCGYDFQLGNQNWSGGSPLDIFIALPAGDPVAGTLPSDPRPSLPLDLFNGSFNQHGMIRSSWSNPTLFTYFFPNSFINHEYNYDGRFDIWSGGEYITKGRVIFNNYNIDMQAANTQNIMQLFNSTGRGCTSSPWCTGWELFDGGGQGYQGEQAGLVSVQHSELPAYAAAISNTTNAYNGAAYGNFPYKTYNDIAAASRSMVFLRGTDQLAFYDRAAVRHPASTQALYQNTTGALTIAGNTATWLTQSGKQKAVYTTLLPRGGRLTDVGLTNLVRTSAPHGSLKNGTTMQVTCTGTNGDGTTPNLSSSPQAEWATGNATIATVSSTGLVTAIGIGSTSIQCAYQGQAAAGTVTVVSGSSGGNWTNVPVSVNQLPDWELASTLSVTPSGTPTSTQFLSLLQWGASSFTPASATLVQSTAGQGFDGELIGSSLVMFMRNWPAIFASVTYPASGATTHYISDLAPNTTYAISGAGAPTSATTDAAGVLVFTATGTGNVIVRTVTTIGAATRFEIPALCTAVALVSSIALSWRIKQARS